MTTLRRVGSNLAFIWNRNLFRLLLVLGIITLIIAALAAGDADSLRSSLQAEPHSRLTSEFRRFDIQAITAVDTLGTHVDGTRSATEVVMQGTTTEGTPISINLIILADGNAIEGFR